MKKMLLLGCVAALAFGSAGAGERGEKALPKMGSPEFAQLREVLAALKLTDAQMAKTYESGVKHEKLLADELEKARKAVREKLVAEIRTVLTDEQKARFDLVMAAMKKRDDAVDAADREFAAKLKDLRMLDLRGPRTEKEFVAKYFERTEELRAKFKAIKTKCEQARNASISLLPPPADDKDSKKSWADSKDRLEHASEAQILEEARNSLTQDQRLALAQAVDALKQWVRTLQIAKDTCAKEVEPPPPPKKNDQRGKKP